MFGPLGADKYREYCRDIHAERPVSARRHQRHPRHVEDRGRPASSSTSRRRARRDPRRRHARRHRRAPTTSSSTLNAEIAPGIALQADRRALKQIVLNLLSNAVKFTPEGGRITVRGRAVARRGHHRDRGYRHRHPAGRAAQARPAVRAGRKPAHQDAITARASASPSPNRWSSCTAAPCASARARRRHDGRACACRSEPRGRLSTTEGEASWPRPVRAPSP